MSKNKEKHINFNYYFTQHIIHIVDDETEKLLDKIEYTGRYDHMGDMKKLDKMCQDWMNENNYNCKYWNNTCTELDYQKYLYKQNKNNPDNDMYKVIDGVLYIKEDIALKWLNRGQECEDYLRRNDEPLDYYNWI
jgi:hypothetical protein